MFIKVKAKEGNKSYVFPFNINTIEQFEGKRFDIESFKEYLSSQKVQFDKIKNSEQVVLSKVGKRLFEKFIDNYTKK